jgi:hypothetical protein
MTAGGLRKLPLMLQCPSHQPGISGFPQERGFRSGFSFSGFEKYGERFFGPRIFHALLGRVKSL